MAAEAGVIAIPVGAFTSNCYLIPAPGSSAALVIDPGDDAAIILAELENRGLVPAAYLLTHGHMDHVSALAEVAARYPAPIGLHPLDAAWAFTPANAAPPYYPTPRAPSTIERAWAAGQRWEDVGFRYDILFTPGHSPGSVSFHFPQQRWLFCGDVLFAGSVGRADLPGASPRTLLASLDTLMALPPDTTVFPGHGPTTTLAHERKTNPWLRDRTWAV